MLKQLKAKIDTEVLSNFARFQLESRKAALKNVLNWAYLSYSVITLVYVSA